MAITVKISVDLAKAKKRIFDDDTGKVVAQHSALLMDKYIPMQSGLLAQTYDIEPYKVTYTSPYAHYLWKGTLMVGENGSSWARSGEKKHYVKGVKLKFNKEMHPNATSHWEQAMLKAKRQELANAITNYIKEK